MNIVVTGSEGFIGKHLVKFLKERGHEVLRIDRKVGTDVKDFKEIITYFIPGIKIDCVVHLAAQTSVWNEDNAQIIQDNVVAFCSLIDTCKELGIPVVYASSSCAVESNITSLYGLTKKFCEDYAAMHWIRAIGLRFHNVYARDSRIGTLPRIIFDGGDVTLYNSGKNQRHFTYIDDILRGICKAIDMVMTWNVTPLLLNICNPEVCTTLDFAQKAMSYMKNEVHLHLSSYKRDKDKEYQNVDTEVDNMFFPEEFTSVDEGLKKCLL